MVTKTIRMLCAAAALAAACARAESRFFRVWGATNLTVTGWSPAGWLSWSNAAVVGTNLIEVADRYAPQAWHGFAMVACTGRHQVAWIAAAAPTGMVFVPEGIVVMGDGMTPSEGGSDERPAHALFTSAFFIGKGEVAKSEWDAIRTWALTRGYGFESAGSSRAADHPVQSVNWYDTVKWCNARSEREGLTPCYYTTPARTVVYRTGRVDITNACVNWTANGYRLPTEAEWEKAARGGAIGRRFPWWETNVITHARANYYAFPYAYAYDANESAGYHPDYFSGEAPYTSPVPSLSANGYGLYGAAGNVWEWCWDWHDASWYQNAASSADNVRGPATGSLRVLRGGCFGSTAWSCRVSRRLCDAPGLFYSDYGFRTVRRADL
jgi:formylglycine-generating enzyme required for sulfatase activity